MTALPTNPLLPPNALRGVRVGVSVSPSTDLARLGLTESHFRLALGEIARSILLLGGSLVYGGHLDPDGYTPFLLSEVQRYGRKDRPLKVCLAWSEHRRKSLTELNQAIDDLGLFGTIDFLDVDGRSIDFRAGRGEAAEPEADATMVGRGLTSLRRFMTANVNGRVLIGGKQSGFQGNMPGVIEEALMAINANQPLFLAGGFGAATLGMVRAVEPAAAAWLPVFAPPAPRDARCDASLADVAAATNSRGWRALNNGLTDDECRRLAATHRPSEIASLTSLGLGRLVKATPPTP